MYRHKMRRPVIMPDLTCKRARSGCPRPKRDAGCGLRTAGGGFTMVEIVIVIVVIGIAALLAIPMMSSAASLQIRSAGNMVAADLEYAKSMAISRGQNYSVTFDTSADSYTIVGPDGNPIEHPVKKGFDYVVSFQNESRLNQVHITNVNFGGTSPQTVTFDCLGSPMNLTVEGTVSLQADGITKTIKVEPVTGFISIP
jgi:prepilin-type N-terminal cleavage/methylation domain-containing protein